MVNGKEKLAKDWKQIAEGIFIDHPDWNAGQVYRQVKVVLGEARAPASVSSVQKEMPKWKRNYSPDRRWSLGAHIPQGNIVPLISLQRQLSKHDRYLTVRRAHWYSVLYPVLSPLLEQAYPDDKEQNELRIMQIASFYCREEQKAKINGEPVLDTTELDNEFLIGCNISFENILHRWVHYFLPGRVTPTVSTTVLNTEDTEPLSQFTKILMQSGVERAITFVKEHPEAQPVAEKWMVLSTRQDLKQIIKDGEK